MNKKPSRSRRKKRMLDAVFSSSEGRTSSGIVPNGMSMMISFIRRALSIGTIYVDRPHVAYKVYRAGLATTGLMSAGFAPTAGNPGEDARSPEIITVRNLTKTFQGKVRAADDITFEVLEGEIFGFLGPNGAGKTTTIDMLTTQLKPSSGSAQIAGYDILKHPNEVRKRIAVVPQDSTSDEELSGYENVMVIANLYGIPKERSQSIAQEVLELVELKDATDRKVRTYSGGMRRRLEIACGLVSRPRVLFLDEPSLGLDVQTREALWRYISKMKEEYPMTVFLTTHYMEEADQLCDRISVIDHGRIVRTGRPDEIKGVIGGDVIELTLDSISDEVSKAISGTEFVLSVESNGRNYRVKVRNGEEVLPLIIELVGLKGHRVRRVSLSRPSLSQAYLELTGRAFREEDPRLDESNRMRRAFG